MKIEIGGIELLDASFRHMRNPLNTPAQPHPQTEVPMEMGLLKGEEPNTYAITLRVGIDSPAALYSLSVTYAVLLKVDPEGAELPPEIDSRVMVTGATMAFPYCRELISNLTSRARFGPVWINPTNFSQIVAAQKDIATAVQE